MKDLIILSGIIIFWVFYFSFIGAVNDDIVLQDLGETGNFSTYIAGDNSQAIEQGNESADTIVIFKETTESKSTGFLNWLWKIVTWKMSDIPDIPAFLAVFIISFNYLLTFLVGIIIYRLIRHGGG